MPHQDDLFATLVENISQGIYVVQDGRAVYLNEPFGRFFGYQEVAPLIGRDLFREIYPDRASADLFEQIHREMLDKENDKNSWAQLSARCDGTPFWLEVEARRIQVNGRPAIFGRFHDQTDCQLIAKAMLVSQETLRLVLDAMEDRVYVVTDDYRIVYANNKMRESIDGDIANAPCHLLCRGLPTPCTDCSGEVIFHGNGGPVHKEFYNERTSGWFSVIEMAIRMPGIDRPTKLAVARDITARKENEKQIRALSHRLLSAQESERKHLSRDLHDDVGQRLNALKIGLETLFQDLGQQGEALQPRLENLTRILQGSIEAVRNLSAGLRPVSLEKLGLVETIRAHCQKLSLVNGLPIDFRAAGMSQLKQLDSDVEINLFRVVQEALNNIIKHAGATTVTIRLTASFPNLRLRIEDDGQGFDLDQRRSGGQQFGLLGMAERAEQLNGTFAIRSRPGAGTCLIFEVPMAQPAALAAEQASTAPQALAG